MDERDVPSDFSHVALLEAARGAGCPALARMANYWGESGGVYELWNLLDRLATMEAAVRAADRLTDASTESPFGIFRTYGPKDLAMVEMKADYEALGAAVKLLEDSDDA